MEKIITDTPGEEIGIGEQLSVINVLCNTGSGEFYISDYEAGVLKAVSETLQKLWQKELLIEIMRNSEEMGLYDSPGGD